MYQFHIDSDRYFEMQKQNCEEYVIPFIEEAYNLKPNFRILEIGCGTAGVLSAFLERGYQGCGVDVNPGSLDYARSKLVKYMDSGQLKLINKDIYAVDFETELDGKFDLIVLKDVIEHIHDQEKLMLRMQSFLCPDGMIFFGFPPWQMPFGGHHQICNSKVLSHFPYLHLLPMPLYRAILKAFKENPDDLCEIKETGISIERFEKIVKKTGYHLVHKTFYLINPIYKYKFSMKVRKQSVFIGSIPYFRNYCTTAVFYLLQTKQIINT